MPAQSEAMGGQKLNYQPNEFKKRSFKSDILLINFLNFNKTSAEGIIINMDQFEVVYLSFFHLRDGSLLIAGGWGTEDFGRDHMIFRTIAGSQLNVIVEQHTPPPPK